MTTDQLGFDLRHHGDAEVGGGLLDFAVNVCRPEPPTWLAEELAACVKDLAHYPDPRPAQRAIATRHGRTPDEVLITAGAAEAFVLLARALTPERAVIVHPQFTEPEAALTAAGHQVERVLLEARSGFALEPAQLPDDADLVVVGNPTNPTSVLHPADTIAALARAGRTLVVDEAFMDSVAGEPDSLARRRDLEGLLVIRSLTKTWALAGLRIGYVLGDARLLDPLRRAQPLWPVSTPALVAARACSARSALDEAARWALTGVGHRDHLIAGLHRAGVHVVEPAQAPFVLARIPDGEAVRQALRARGIAVRRGDTFPGLDRDWLRIAVRPPELTDQLIAALRDTLSSPADRLALI